MSDKQEERQGDGKARYTGLRKPTTRGTAYQSRSIGRTPSICGETSVNFYLPEFHFGFNTSRDHFEKIAKTITEENPELIKMAPKTIDAGTAMERRKMYLNSPSGYLIEIKGVNQ